MKIFIFDRNDADACSAVRKVTSEVLRPGMFIPLTEGEFVAMRDSVMSIDIGDVVPADDEA